MAGHKFRNYNKISSILVLIALAIYWILFAVWIGISISNKVEMNYAIPSISILALSGALAGLFFGYRELMYTLDEDIKGKRWYLIFISTLALIIGGPVGIAAGIISLVSLKEVKNLFKL